MEGEERTLENICQGMNALGSQNDEILYCGIGRNGRRIKCDFAKFIGEIMPICSFYEFDSNFSSLETNDLFKKYQ